MRWTDTNKIKTKIYQVDRVKESSFDSDKINGDDNVSSAAQVSPSQPVSTKIQVLRGEIKQLRGYFAHYTTSFQLKPVTARAV